MKRKQLEEFLGIVNKHCRWLEIYSLSSEDHLDNQYSDEYVKWRTQERKWTDRLFAGGTIQCLDYYDEDKNGQPREYLLKLPDFAEGFKKALSDSDLPDSIKSWISCEQLDDNSKPCCYDYNDLMQFILFGEVLYP